MRLCYGFESCVHKAQCKLLLTLVSTYIILFTVLPGYLPISRTSNFNSQLPSRLSYRAVTTARELIASQSDLCEDSQRVREGLG